jgi:hypothetical protein
MKTTMKQLAAGTFIAILLLVGNVNAKGIETKASSHENFEATLQVEKWMTDEFIWNTNLLGIAEFGAETEATLELENWMTSAETWNLSSSFIEETETGMDLETWMTNESTWNVGNMNHEADLTVEKWMTENNVWK